MLEFTNHLSLFFVFAEGVISFFSPCILPLLPVYVSYLSKNARVVKEDGSVFYKQGTVLLYTLCFILGISASFFILGFGFTALGSFFKEQRDMITKIGGTLIIIMGLIQIGFLKIPFLNNEKRMNLGDKFSNMSLPLAFLLGFVFSFAWTPCVGPALSSVLIMAGSASTAWLSIAYILTYAIGFLLPFIAIGMFTSKVLNLLKRHQQVVRYTIKAGGIILVIIGAMMLSGTFSLTGSSDTPEETTEEQSTNQDKQAAYDFSMKDQNGNVHKLSDYKGKVVMVNFWATWCGYCKEELPVIQERFLEYGENNGDVIILSIVQPGGQEKSQDDIKSFIDEQGVTYPVLFDDGKAFQKYSVSSLPTTFMIDRDGNIFGYLSGGLKKDTIQSIVQQTIDGKMKQE